MKTAVIQTKCIACGKCYSILPEVFDLDDEGIAFNKLGDDTTIPTVHTEKLRTAVASCPTRAITFTTQNDT